MSSRQRDYCASQKQDDRGRDARALHQRSRAPRHGSLLEKYNFMVLRVAVAGLGAVGLPVAQVLLAGGIPGMQLAAVSASSAASAASKLSRFGAPDVVPCLPVEQLCEHADVVVEGLPPASFLDVAKPTLSSGKTLIVMSVTQMLVNPGEI